LVRRYDVRLRSRIALRWLRSDHAHAEATYHLLTLPDGTFAVEVAIPSIKPTKVSGFDTREKAEAWIERHRAKIATGLTCR